MSEHADVLSQLFPLKLQGVLEADLLAEGGAFDAERSAINATLSEMFCDTADETLARWEARYAIIPPPGASKDQRRAAIVARKRQRGGCDDGYYVRVAAGLGYTITITPHDDLCRLPATLPDSLYEKGDLWKWTVTVLGESSAPDLEAVLNDIKRAHTQITFVYSP
jgi:uncharacterized protein YmfQ (DUF2313 family)